MSSGIITPSLTGFSLSSASVVFGAAAPTIVAPTLTSGGAITYTSATPGVATITSSGVIAIMGAGSTVITATQAANGNYASTTATTTLTVTAATYIAQGGLTWAPITNQANWSTAQSACSSMSNDVYASGWRQPTQAELLALYNSGSLLPTPAGWSLGRTWSSTFHSTLFHRDVDLSSGNWLWMHNNNDYVSCVH